MALVWVCSPVVMVLLSGCEEHRCAAGSERRAIGYVTSVRPLRTQTVEQRTQVDAAADAGLRHESLDVLVDGAAGDDELLGDLRARAPCRDEQQHVVLAFGD